MKKIIALNTASSDNPSNLYADPLVLLFSIAKYLIKLVVATIAIHSNTLEDKVATVEGIAPKGNAFYVMPVLTFLAALSMLRAAWKKSHDPKSTNTVLTFGNVGFVFVGALDITNAILVTSAKIQNETPESNIFKTAAILGLFSVASFAIYSLYKLWIGINDLHRHLLSRASSPTCLKTPWPISETSLDIITNAAIVASETSIVVALSNTNSNVKNTVLSILSSEGIALIGTSVSESNAVRFFSRKKGDLTPHAIVSYV